MRQCLLILLFLALFSCNTQQDLSVQNFSFIYKRNANPFRPDITVYHHSADSSLVFLKFDTEEFLGVMENNIPLATYFYSYQLFNSIDENKLIDSASFPACRVPKGEIVNHTMKIHLGKGSYFMQLKIYDVNKKVAYSFYENIDKKDEESRQFYLVKRRNDVLYSEIISNRIPLKLEYADKTQNEVYVKYYNRKFPIADPPFALDKPSNFNYRPDSIFSIKNIRTDSISLINEGFYHFQLNVNSKEGLTLFRFYDDFPNILTPQQMIEPVRYLTTKKEYDDLNNQIDKRHAIDKFWLSLGDNAERTRELIRKYYSRVVEANKLFSSYKEGWKTDRGMIYIIYGAPNVVYKTSNSESWIYGDETSFLSTNFTFVKVTNPFTDNDYALNRAPLYQANWYSSIDIWRHGRALNDN